MAQEIGYSISAGRPAYDHDLRITIAYNIDKDLMRDNVVLIDEVNGKKIHEYIDELMQPTIDEYNAHQKRKDRQINMSYTEWHKSQGNKGDLFFEYVLQFGEGETIGREYYEAAKLAAEDPKNEELQLKKNELKNKFIDVYQEWTNKLQEMGFKIAYATIHFDEGIKTIDGKEICGTPHLHAGVIPIPDYEFKRGPKMQISMSQLLIEHGIDRVQMRSEAKKDEQTKSLFQQGRFFVNFREYQERTLKERGYEIKQERDDKQPHQAVELYVATRRAQDRLSEAQRAVESELKQLDELQHQNDQLTSEIEEQTSTKEQNQNDINKQENVIASMRQEYIQLSHEIDRQKTTYKKAAIAIQNVNDKLCELDQQKTDLEALIAGQKLELKDIKDKTSLEYKQAQQKLKELQDAYSKLSNDVSAKQTELDKASLKLEQVAKSIEAFSEKAIKRAGSMFQKKEDLFTMNINQRNEVLAQNDLVKNILKSEVYTPQERAAMQRAESSARDAERSYKQKESNLDQLIEQGVQKRVELLNRTEPQQIRQLQNKLSKLQQDHNYTVEAIKMFLADNGISQKEFERNYSIRLDGRSERHYERDDR